jgi:hypothetical protein
MRPEFLELMPVLQEGVGIWGMYLASSMYVVGMKAVITQFKAKVQRLNAFVAGQCCREPAAAQPQYLAPRIYNNPMEKMILRYLLANRLWRLRMRQLTSQRYRTTTHASEPLFCAIQGISYL